MTQTTQPPPTVMPLTPSTPPDILPRLRRNSYWHGKSMGVDEFMREQTYYRTLQQTLTRLTVGSGVLCGLIVSPHGDSGVALSDGAAIDGLGRLIVVPTPAIVDKIVRLMGDDDQEGPPPGDYELCVLHHECPIAPSPVLVTDCDTHVECRPGAVEERFRLQARRVERAQCDHSPHDRRGGARERCSQPYDDCVVVAHFRWDGERIVHLRMDRRRELPTLAQLGGYHDETSDRSHQHNDGPRLLSMWPKPGTTLDRDGSPSEWGRWRYRPRLELRFDQPVTWGGDDPSDWLRAWVLPPRAATESSKAHRVQLRPLPDATATNTHGQTVVFAVETDATTDAVRAATKHGFTVIVQARASSDRGPTAASAVPRPAQLAYRGTVLTRAEADALWEHDKLPDEVADDLSDRSTPTRLPEGFGDGYDGGVLHATFHVAPVGDQAAITGVYPHNGARVGSKQLPSLQISTTANPGTLKPRAWLIGDRGDVVELDVGKAERLRSGAPEARDRYQSDFDATLESELAHTVTFTLANPGDRLQDGGRVLVVVTSNGSFAGTCLTDAEAAHIYHRNLDVEHLAHVRPSSARMPRAGTSGSWIHWTFAWEQNNVVNR